MKKFLATLLALIMVLSLAACGGSKEETPAPEAPEQTEALPPLTEGRPDLHP